MTRNKKKLDIVARVKEGYKNPEHRTCKLTLSQIEDLFSMYCSGMSMNGMAKKLGVERSTISRYLYKGSVSRDIEPLKDRRDRLYASMSEFTDKQIEDVFRNTVSKISRFADVVGDRWLERVSNAHLLDDEELYKEDNEAKLKAVQAKALNPDTKDLVEVVKSLKELGNLFRPDPGTTVNVNTQNNANIEVSKEDIKEFLTGQFSDTVEATNRSALDDFIAKKSLESEEDNG